MREDSAHARNHNLSTAAEIFANGTFQIDFIAEQLHDRAFVGLRMNEKFTLMHSIEHVKDRLFVHLHV